MTPHEQESTTLPDAAVAGTSQRHSAVNACGHRRSGRLRVSGAVGHPGFTHWPAWKDPRDEAQGCRPPAQQSERFWRSYLALGYGLLALESAAVAMYLLRTPQGPDRPVLLVIAAGQAVTGLIGFYLAGWLSRQAWRARFSFAWSMTAALVLAYCAHLDGGLESPMLYLSTLPVLYASMALRTGEVACVGAATGGGIVTIGMTDPVVAIPQESLLMFTAFGLGVTLLAVLSARHRARLQADDHASTQLLIELSVSDALTGCRNQRLFRERLAEEVDRANRYQRPLSLIVCDVDLFKDFNDLYGHDVGDAVLASIGAHLRAHARATDVVARIGGDEFALLLPETSASDAAEMAAHILTPPITESGLRASLSVGVASLDHREPTAQRLFRDADQAMYDAKASGRASVTVTAPGNVRAGRGNVASRVTSADRKREAKRP